MVLVRYCRHVLYDTSYRKFDVIQPNAKIQAGERIKMPQSSLISSRYVSRAGPAGRYPIPGSFTILIMSTSGYESMRIMPMKSWMQQKDVKKDDDDDLEAGRKWKVGSGGAGYDDVGP